MPIFRVCYIIGLILWSVAAIIRLKALPSLEEKKRNSNIEDLNNNNFYEAEYNDLNNIFIWCFLIGGFFIGIGQVLTSEN